MPDILLWLLIGLSVTIITVAILANEDIRFGVFLLLPISLLIWLVVAANLSWETKAFSCSISEIILPNGGKASMITYMQDIHVVTKTLPYHLDTSKSYVVDVPNTKRLYGGIYFVGIDQTNNIFVREVSPEVDK